MASVPEFPDRVVKKFHRPMAPADRRGVLKIAVFAVWTRPQALLWEILARIARASYQRRK
jgi:hypothetical protein